jgi:O-antigen ligase
MAIMIVIAIVMAGSRSGLLVGGLGFLGAAAIVWGRYPLRWSGRSRRLWILPVGGMALLTVLVASAAFLGRAQAIDRLLAADPMADKRTRTLSTVTDVLWTYFPIGSGFGSFDVAFRQAEPFRLLEGTYFNQAHDDLIQVILEGGIVGLALLVTLLIWLGWSTIRAWRGPGSSQAGACARASSTALLLLVLASTVPR